MVGNYISQPDFDVKSHVLLKSYEKCERREKRMKGNENSAQTEIANKFIRKSRQQKRRIKGMQMRSSSIEQICNMNPIKLPYKLRRRSHSLQLTAHTGHFPTLTNTLENVRECQRSVHRNRSTTAPISNPRMQHLMMDSKTWHRIVFSSFQ